MAMLENVLVGKRLKYLKTKGDQVCKLLSSVSEKKIVILTHIHINREEMIKQIWLTFGELG